MMKKGIMCVMIAVMATVFAGSAYAANLEGLYIAPKFIYSSATMGDIKADIDGWPYKFKDNDGAAGGSLAVGYDFSKCYQVPFRAEIEFSMSADMKSSHKDTLSEPFEWQENLQRKYDIQTLFLNVYYDINTNTAFTPYIGAGVGLAFLNTKFHASETTRSLLSSTETYESHGAVSSGSKTTVNMAFNVGAGVSYALTQHLSLDAGYRFMYLGRTGNAKLSGSLTESYNGDYAGTFPLTGRVDSQNIYMHQFSIGVRYTW